jgi:ATP-dependent metalloprotease FtsH
MGRAIIFIDEIDSIGRKRGAGLGGGHDEREQTLNQMLSEMDGFETAEGIVIMAATNRPDILDPALLRPGRFDRSIVVPLPEFEERKAILEVHSRDKRMGPDVDLDVMAKATPGMSGADLANLVNEAALVAVRRGSKQVERIDFENARDRVVLGAQRESLVLNAEERRSTAYHEGGHAVLATVLPHGDPLHKVTILPRGMALGVTWSLPEERHTYSSSLAVSSLYSRPPVMMSRARVAARHPRGRGRSVAAHDPGLSGRPRSDPRVGGAATPGDLERRIAGGVATQRQTVGPEALAHPRPARAPVRGARR